MPETNSNLDEAQREALRTVYQLIWSWPKKTTTGSNLAGTAPMVEEPTAANDSGQTDSNMKEPKPTK